MKPKTLLNLNENQEAVKTASIEHAKINLNSVSECSDVFVTAPEILKILGISYLTFTKWLKQGRFDGVRMLNRQKGECYKFYKSDFEQWLNNNHA